MGNSKYLGILICLSCMATFAYSFKVNGKYAVEMKQGLEPAGVDGKPQAGSEPLTLQWGIADAVAYVGQLFTYTLPSDAFQGNVVHYHVTEAGKTTLPSWLVFNDLKTELRGIPGPKDKGQIYIEVKATGDDNSHADDVFSIEVKEDMLGGMASSTSSNRNAPKHVVCKREEPQTIATIIIDTDIDNLKAGERITLLENMASHLNLAPEMLKQMPVGDKPMFDTTALVAGPGNVKDPKHAGGLMMWRVGCGTVADDHMPVLQHVESSAANGDLSGALGKDIIGWHVTNSRFQVKPRRRRAAATVTPTPTTPPPSKMSDQVSKEDMTSSIMSSKVSIMPSKTVEVKPTSIVVKPTTSSSSTSSEVIAPSETVKMTKTMVKPTDPVPTSALPSKSYKMSSSAVKTDSPVMPSSTVPTTTSTVTTTTKQTTSPTPAPTTPKPMTMQPKPTPEPPKCDSDSPPVVNKPLKDITIHAGNMGKTKIPEDTFTHCEIEDTNDLDLEILLANGEELPAGFWLQLVHKNFKYQFRTNPLNKDAGSYEFKLKATYFWQSVSHDFTINVLGDDMSEEPPNHELSMSMDIDYDKFMSKMDNRITLANKISKVFGDKSPKHMTVTRIDRGSVIYAWTNNSIAGSDCPVETLGEVFSNLVDENGKLTPKAQDALQDYKITSAASVPLGSCADNPNFPVRDTKSVKITTKKPMVPSTKAPTSMAPTTLKLNTKGTVEETKPMTTKSKIMESTTTETKIAAAGAGGGGSDIWITTVVPAIVVIVVLIIAIIVACCLYRKKRKGKMKLEEQNSFNNKKAAAPVIFADEYDEKPNDSTRPLIMEDEKPPMPPPEYQRASSETSGNSNSTQPIGEVEEIEMDDTDITSPLYPPPPPVTSTNNSKPPHVHSARGPPPYVPP